MLSRQPHAAMLSRQPHAAMLSRQPHAAMLSRQPHAGTLDLDPPPCVLAQGSQQAEWVYTGQAVLGGLRVGCVGGVLGCVLG